jgi:alanyl-tRNA synthetase
VDADYFRFDFNHSKGLSQEEREAIEQQVNEVIAQKADVITRVMKPEEAVAVGAMALFGEKYGDEVRVLSMGKGDNNGYYSIELCGGTHVSNVGEITKFVITGESSVAAGIRRIEAMTGKAADAWLAAQKNKQAEEEARRKQAEAAKAAQAGSLNEARDEFRKAIDTAQTVGNVTYLGKAIEGVQGKDLRTLVDDFKAARGSGVVAIVAANDGKASIVVGVTDDLKDRFNAVELLKKGAEAMGGKGGGGRPDFAQGGAPDAGKAEAALEVIRNALAG